MSNTSQRDEGRDPKSDQAKKNEPRKSHGGVPVKEPSGVKPARIDLERQHRGRNGR